MSDFFQRGALKWLDQIFISRSERRARQIMKECDRLERRILEARQSR